MREQEARNEARRQWLACLNQLEADAPKLREDPWLFVRSSDFARRLIDALKMVLDSFRDHPDDLERTSSLLKLLFETFVDLARFAKNQPGFYIVHPETVQACVKLLSSVAYKSSDRSLFPSILMLLRPTFERPHLHGMWLSAQIVPALLCWSPQPSGDWAPSDDALYLFFNTIRLLSATVEGRAYFLAHREFQTALFLARGVIEGLSPEQQQIAMTELSEHYARKLTEPLSDQERSAALGLE